MSALSPASQASHAVWFQEAARVASAARCLRAKCGAVIVQNGEIIGEGYNAPPGDDCSLQKCDRSYDRMKKPKYDLTCCVHAEWRAIIAALQHAQGDLVESTIYYVSLDENGERKNSGQPFCTVCSRLACDVGIKYFALWHDTGIVLYETNEYNDLSYAYHKL